MAPAIRTVAAAAALLLLAAAVGAPSGVAAAAKATPRATPTPVPDCTGSRCTAFGPGARCTLDSPKGDFVTTCKTFAGFNGTCEAIASACVTNECDRSKVIYGSDGNPYCNWCTLTAASCESGFKLYKVARDTTTPTPSSKPGKTPPGSSTVPAPSKKPVTSAAPVLPGPDGCTPLAAGKAVRQAFPPYSDLACPEDYTLCERNADCGSGPGDKQMVCALKAGCSSSRCSRMSVSKDRKLCEGTGRCTRDCRRGQGVCTPVFC